MDKKRNNMMTIALGNVCIGICCNSIDFLQRMRVSYRPFIVTKPPELVIELNLKDELSVDEARHLILSSKTRKDGNRYYTEPEFIDCQIDWDKAKLLVNTDKRLFDRKVGYKLMNILFRGIYSGIYRRLRKTGIDSYIVHGCGIADDCRCYLFTGPSGSGKTTIASLAQGREVLNDEAVMIGRNHRGFNLTGTPFDGGVSQRSFSSYPLSAIFFLQHGMEVILRKLNGTDSYKRLLLQVFDTSPLFDTPDQLSFSDQADICAEIAASVPAYELSFRPEPSFWSAIDFLKENK